MKQVLLRHGKAAVDQVPAPQLEAGSILVQVDHSCISIGTELSGLKMSGAPLWKRALKQPENVKKVLQMIANSGIARTRSVISGQLTAGSPTGYSAAGVVLKVGEEVTDLKLGDRVACAGAQCAHHAEYICVPRNLAVPIPEALAFAEASTVTLGAIAMQGVRRASPTLGETFVVIGLGILGQLTAQMLRTNGCRVVGVDIDNSRIQLATTLGMDTGILPEHGDNIEQIFRLTDGIGADGVIITAATPSDEVIATAFKMCRKKGRVILVGDVGLHLNRSDFYQKELDFFISSSYGPGRYDHNYEEKGLDYPVAYVRWTENRNMAEYLRLIAENKINIKSLIAATYSIDDATQAYQALESKEEKPLMVLLQYPQVKNKKDLHKIANVQAKAAGNKQIRLAIVGAGGFAKGMHLPNIKKLSSRYHIQAIVSRSGHNAIATAKQFGANYGTTDYQQMLLDPEIDAVLIATRHHLHAEMVLQALQAGKHVMVEKPLALNESELEKIMNFYEQAPSGKSLPILLTGFNRRFSKFIQRIHEIILHRSNPMILNYQMNAGYLPLDHWLQGAKDGGRNIGEACHIYDVFTYLTNSQVLSVTSQMIVPKTAYYSAQDNFVVSMNFEDGSVANLTYTALGSRDHPKEQLTVFVDGKILALNDYKSLKIYGAKVKGIETKNNEKGQLEEMIAFADAIQKSGEWPIPLWQQIQATQISFQVDNILRNGKA